jgi:hypothetical protein
MTAGVTAGGLYDLNESAVASEVAGRRTKHACVRIFKVEHAVALTTLFIYGDTNAFFAITTP